MERGDIDFDPLDEPGSQSANFDYDDAEQELDEILNWDVSERQPLLPSEEIQMKEFGHVTTTNIPKTSETSFADTTINIEEAKREAPIKNARRI